MWIPTYDSLPKDIDDQVAKLLGSHEGRATQCWLSLETGSQIVLAHDGSHHDPTNSAFHALYCSPAGQVTDVSLGLLGGPVTIATAEEGSGKYARGQQAVAQYIDKVLSVQYPEFSA